MLRRSLTIEGALLVAVAVAGCSDVESPQPKSQSPVAQAAIAAADDSLSGYVLTPFGWRPASRVTKLSEGHSLRVLGGRLQDVDAAGTAVRDIGEFTTQVGGVPLFPNNVMREPPGTPPIASLGSGWITYAYWNRPLGQSIKADTTKWIVPPAPSSWDGQTIFLFNGIQSSSWILQPVLQYGPSRAGGGNYWSVACWYADGSNASYSSLHPVNTGNLLTSVVDSGVPGSGVSYYCAAHAPSFDVELDLTGPVPELFEAVETLEASGLVACSDYPNVDSTAFTSISIRTHTGIPSLSWTPVNQVTDCGQYAHVVSNANPGGEVDLFYRNPPPPPPPPLYVTISGSRRITTKGTYTWTANPSGGAPPYGYQWFLHYDGGLRYQEGTHQSQSLTVYGGDPNFWMIVTVTGGGTASDSVHVMNCITDPEGCDLYAPAVASGRQQAQH